MILLNRNDIRKVNGGFSVTVATVIAAPIFLGIAFYAGLWKKKNVDIDKDLLCNRDNSIRKVVQASQQCVPNNMQLVTWKDFNRFYY